MAVFFTPFSLVVFIWLVSENRWESQPSERQPDPWQAMIAMRLSLPCWKVGPRPVTVTSRVLPLYMWQHGRANVTWRINNPSNHEQYTLGTSRNRILCEVCWTFWLNWLGVAVCRSFPKLLLEHVPMVV